jgi:hypothetical protein
MRSNTITLYFDTIKRDRKERTYRMSSTQEAKQLLSFLRNILSGRDLSEMNQKVYRCAKCSAQFSREVNSSMGEFWVQFARTRLLLKTSHRCQP